MPDHAEYFVVGIFSYHLFQRLRSWQLRLDQSLPWTMGSVVLLIVLIQPLRDLVARPYESHAGEWLPLAIWIFVLSLLLETQSPRASGFAVNISKFFLHPAIQWAGKVSYSTYLIHYFAIYAVMLAVGAMGLTLNKYQSLALMLMVASPLILGLSWCCFRFVEQPGIALGRKVTRADSR